MAKENDQQGVLIDVLDPGSHAVDPVEAARSAEALRRLPPEAELTLTADEGRPLRLPHGLAPVIASILQEAAEGHTVAVLSTAREVGTGTAARLLGVSRPHVAKLIDAQILPGRRVRKHRRVRLADLLAYKREMDRRHALLDQLMEESEAMGLYEPLPDAGNSRAG